MQAQDRPTRSEIIESLFHQYGNDIYRYVKYSAPQDIDPADVVQEVFVRAFRSWDGFKAHSSPKTWLFAIARNYVYDLLRKKQHEREYMASLRMNGDEKQTDIESLLEIEDALFRLKPDDQQVLNLRLIQDLSVTDTAKILGWNEVKVRVTFHRAKKKLQDLLLEPEVPNWTKKGDETVETKR